MIIELGKKLYNFGVKLRVKTSCSIVVTVKNSDKALPATAPLKKGSTEDVKLHDVHITLASKNLPSLQKALAMLQENAKKYKVRSTRGPYPMPTKVLRVTTRKSPCGEGTNTWDKFQLRIHRRVFRFVASSDEVISVTNFTMDPDVDFNFEMKNVASVN